MAGGLLIALWCLRRRPITCRLVQAEPSKWNASDHSDVMLGRRGASPGNKMKQARSKRGTAQDRRKVAGGQGYEVNYFATKHGNDRQKLNAAAERLAHP